MLIFFTHHYYICYIKFQIGIGISGTKNPKSKVDFQEVYGSSFSIPTIFELVSNEHDFSEKSSYTFDLNADARKKLIKFMIPK